MLKFCVGGIALSAAIIAASLHHALNVPTVPHINIASDVARPATPVSGGVKTTELPVPAKDTAEGWQTFVVRSGGATSVAAAPLMSFRPKLISNAAVATAE